MNRSTEFVTQVKNIAEYLNWPEIESASILNILELGGVPRTLLNLDEDFDLSIYVKHGRMILMI